MNELYELDSLLAGTLVKIDEFTIWLVEQRRQIAELRRILRASENTPIRPPSVSDMKLAFDNANEHSEKATKALRIPKPK